MIRYFFEPLTAPTGFQITFPPRFKVIKLHFILPTYGQLTLDCVRQLSELIVDLLFSLRENETTGIWIVLSQKGKHIENKSKLKMNHSTLSQKNRPKAMLKLKPLVLDLRSTDMLRKSPPHNTVLFIIVFHIWLTHCSKHPGVDTAVW